MFAITKSTRPDRCELCRWSATETRYLPPPPGSIRTWSPVSSVSSYDSQTEPTSVLVCKRMPPSPNEAGHGVSPVVWAGDYCGEFEAKD